jgi:hypothetical protein
MAVISPEGLLRKRDRWCYATYSHRLDFVPYYRAPPFFFGGEVLREGWRQTDRAQVPNRLPENLLPL